MRPHPCTFFGENNERGRLRLRQGAGRDGGPDIITGNAGHAVMRSTVRLPLV
jgi:hypothetical protein